MKRIIVLAALAVALTATSATVASAAAPVVTDIDIPLHSLGADPFLSDVCGFDVEVLTEKRIRVLEYADGSSQSHHHEIYFWQANGRSLVERVNFTIADNGETLTFRGTVFHLVVPGVGPALVEAGIAVFGPGGEVVRLAGLHQVIEGTGNPAAVCDYLAGQ